MFDNINLMNIFWTVLNLAVLLLLMKKFLFGPVTRMMDQRQQSITDALQSAAEKDKAAGEKAAEYDARLEQASIEAAKIVAEARTRAQREYDETLKKAQADAQLVLEGARRQTELDREQMLAGVRSNLAELVLLAAAKLCRAKADPDGDRALVDDFLADVGREP